MSGVAAGRSHAFRPDLEGLRAVAVGLVLLYHARVPGFGGGYIGVDVFFVLSGFLITGLLIRELTDTGRISFWDFYARRTRRLLPASLVTLLVTAVVVAIVLPPLRVPDVEADIAAAAGYVSNLRFAYLATDYLASELPPSPVLHFWSLGVEEQFYLFWPALLALAAGAAFAARRVGDGVRRVTVTLVVVFVLSLGAAIWLTGVQQPWAFFSLPTRAWELALGGLLAVPAAARLTGSSVVAGRVAAWLGLALIAVAGVRFTDGTPYPGTAALLPTLGAALVIWGGAGRPEGAAALPGPGPLLSLPPIRYLGRISYSLYLWHWPVLVLPAAVLGPLPGPVRLALAGVAIVIAAASQRWIEEPFHRGRFAKAPSRRILAASGLSGVTVVVGGLLLGALSASAIAGAPGPILGGSLDDLPTLAPTASASPSTGSPTPGGSPTPAATLPPLTPGPVPGDLAPSLTRARDDLPVIYGDGCHADPDATTPAASCVFGDASSDVGVVLFGDSHAAQWFPALDRLAKERHWKLTSMTKSGCASIDVPVWSVLYNRPYTECDAWREAALERILKERPAIVVVANARRTSLTVDGGTASSEERDDLWAEGLTKTIERLERASIQVVLIGDTTRMEDDPPVCLSKHLDDASKCATPLKTALAGTGHGTDRRAAEGNGVTYVDPTAWLCPTDPCPVVIGRFLVYRDEHHMTATFARALASRLGAAFPAVP